MALHIKRVYDQPRESDGVRILVDRLWPRGLSKEKACLDEWGKELSPSGPLRRWFGHKEERFLEFSALYRAELDTSTEAQITAQQILLRSRTGTVTLLYGAKDPQINHASVLKVYLDDLADGADMEEA